MLYCCRNVSYRYFPTPSSSTDGQIACATALTSSMALSTATHVPAYSIIGISFSESPNAMTSCGSMSCAVQKRCNAVPLEFSGDWNSNMKGVVLKHVTVSLVRCFWQYFTKPSGSASVSILTSILDVSISHISDKVFANSTLELWRKAEASVPSSVCSANM